MKNRMKKHQNRRLCAAVCLLLPVLAACPQPQAVGKQAKAQKAEDLFTADDAVGSLGGIPIRMSGYTPSGFVEYEDTPVGLSKEWQTYKRPKRTLESPITGFTVDLNLETGKLFDPRKGSIPDFFEESGRPNTPWASVIFKAKEANHLPDYLDRRLAENVREKPTLPEYTFKHTGQTQYGLEVYTQLEPETHTGFSDTIFIARGKQGEVSSYIKCHNNTNNVPNPPCRHEFVSAASPYIMFSVGYSRHRLHDWQKIEKLAEEKLAEFADNAKHPERKL